MNKSNGSQYFFIFNIVAVYNSEITNLWVQSVLAWFYVFISTINFSLMWTSPPIPYFSVALKSSSGLSVI